MSRYRKGSLILNAHGEKAIELKRDQHCSWCEIRICDGTNIAQLDAMMFVEAVFAVLTIEELRELLQQKERAS